MCTVADGWRSRVFASTNRVDCLFLVDLEWVATELSNTILIYQIWLVGFTRLVAPRLLL